MKIIAVQHAVPSKRITNEWILQQIREQSGSTLPHERLVMLEKQVINFLERAGTQVRYRLDDGERAIDFALSAGRSALREAGISPQEVDFLIYAGIGRGWIEPAMANVVQRDLGLKNATCFDVVDACASWLRALHVAHSYLRSETYRCGMIVNCEFDCASYEDWNMNGVEDPEHRFAAATTGEAASAAVVTNENPADDFYFKFNNFGEYVELCMIPLPNVTLFTRAPIAERYVPLKFVAYSRELLGTATKKVLDIFENDPTLQQGKYDICFGHAASEKAARMIAKKLGIASAYYPTHSRYGNTGAASVPLGMSLAVGENRLRRGDRVLIIVAGAGITVGFAAFTF